MRPRLKSLRTNGNFKITFTYEDGLVAELDFRGHLEGLHGPIARPLIVPEYFGQAFIDHGVVTWPSGFDICPDVLRFWCEQGRVGPEDETNAHFANMVMA